MAHLVESLKNGEVYGIKGVCPYMSVIEIPQQVPFDPMHLVLQGHTKWILQMLTTPSSSVFIGNYKNGLLTTFLL